MYVPSGHLTTLVQYCGCRRLLALAVSCLWTVVAIHGTAKCSELQLELTFWYVLNECFFSLFSLDKAINAGVQNSYLIIYIGFYNYLFDKWKFTASSLFFICIYNRSDSHNWEREVGEHQEPFASFSSNHCRGHPLGRWAKVKKLSFVKMQWFPLRRLLYDKSFNTASTMQELCAILYIDMAIAIKISLSQMI